MAEMTSAQRKLAWGVERIKTLYAEADVYRGSNAYLFDTEHELRSANQIHFRCFATEVEPPPDHWPLLAGDAIQNVRASLDHAVWTAWRSVKENTGDGDHTQFVICDDPDGWRRSQWHLDGVPDPVGAVIERSQPYNRWPQNPAADSFSILRRLSNTDKHRTLAVVASAIEFEMVGLEHPDELKNWKHATGKRLRKGRAQISSFDVISDAQVDPMKVRPDFTYDVTIESMQIAVLKGIVHEVFQVLVEIETGTPPHPLAPYPL